MMPPLASFGISIVLSFLGFFGIEGKRDHVSFDRLSASSKKSIRSSAGSRPAPQNVRFVPKADIPHRPGEDGSGAILMAN
jgi:hypothetical protein